jgi:hypothetical protein
MSWFIVSSQLGGWFTKSFHWADASRLIWVEKSESRFRFFGGFQESSVICFIFHPPPSVQNWPWNSQKNRPPGRKLEKWPSNERQGRSKFPLRTFSKFSRLLPATRVSVGDFCFSAPTPRANKRGEREMRGEVELNAVTRNPVVPSVFDEKTVARSHWPFTLNSIKIHCFI